MKKGLWFVSALMLMLGMGCSGVLDEGDVGGIRVVVGAASASPSSVTPQVFQPLFDGGSAAISMGVITLTKGSQRIDKSFDFTTSPVNVTLNAVQVGNWNISIALYDADGFKIYEGSSTVIVKKGVTSTASITVSAVTGNLEIIIDVPGPFLVLDENFDDGIANGWVLELGNGFVTNGEYHLIAQPGTPWQGGYLFYGEGNTSLSNYVFEFDVKGLEGFPNGAMRPLVFFRTQAWNPSYITYRLDMFPMDTLEPAITPGYFSCCEYNGTFTMSPALTNGVSEQFVREWNHVEISVIGNVIKAYVNGALIFEVTDPSPIYYGGIGLGSINTTGTVYDNVKLWLY
jgi:hypothetical protein